jgi:hypothetical protein
MSLGPILVGHEKKRKTTIVICLVAIRIRPARRRRRVDAQFALISEGHPSGGLRFLLLGE